MCSGLQRACTSCSQPCWKTSAYIQGWLSSETIETIKTIYSLWLENGQSRILIADYWNNRIDIIDQDGQFIRCIDNLHILSNPCALCVDRRDNLFVVESNGNRVKKYQILQLNYNNYLYTRFICVCTSVIQRFLIVLFYTCHLYPLFNILKNNGNVSIPQQH